MPRLFHADLMSHEQKLHKMQEFCLKYKFVISFTATSLHHDHKFSYIDFVNILDDLELFTELKYIKYKERCGLLKSDYT